MYKTLRVLIGFAALCLAHTTQAQLIGNTPYSRYGLGEINENYGSIRGAGMAGAGISAGNSFQPNTQNPALLYYNSITNFDISGAGELKNVKSSNASQLDGNGNLYNLSLVVPLSKRWSSAVGLRPYTTINYEISATSEVEGNPQAQISRDYTGEGGLSEVYFAHGVRLFGGLTIGGSASFVFGNTITESSSTVIDPQQAGADLIRVTQIDRTTYRDFIFRAGINYRQKLKDKLYLSAGGTYSFENDLEAERDISYERRSPDGLPVAQPVAEEDTVSGTIHLPANWRAGLTLDNGNNLTISADFSTYEWSKFRDFNGRNDNLKDSYRAAVGAEYTPNANAIDSYFKRITYRAGVYYNDTQFQLNGEDIKDMGVTTGFTLPLGRGTLYDLYMLNLSLGYGQRGTTDNGLIKEDYLQFGLGFTVNSRWFLKRRIE
ncbi:MAG: outer membrane protein transport protein [Pontibacter sp.]|nr:outer membrane protein transport protein [Pontibacter sp.]